jgi:integrase
MPRLKLSPKAKTPPPTEGDRLIYWGEKLPGFGLMVTAGDHRSYVYQYRCHGRSRRMTLDGSFLRFEAARTKHGAPKSSKSPLEAARWEAQKAALAVRDGRDPLDELRRARQADSNSVRSIANEFFEIAGKGMRSLDERKAVFERHVFPRFGSRPVDSIKRSEIVRLLEKISVENGPVAAAHVLVALRRLFGWHAARNDDFLNPIIRGMGKDYKAEERSRVLDDNELRVIWQVAQEHRNPYSDLLRFILLTATRLREASDMNHSELNADGTEWTIPGSRYKTAVDHAIPLSSAAQALLAEVPRVGQAGWVFTTAGKTPISGFSKAKREFDKRVLAELRRYDPEAEPLPNWRTHDLRRTSRSLLSRAGISPDIAERCLGHVIGGVRGTYDRHRYETEKLHAFEALASMIDRVVNPQTNVVSLRSG